MRKRRFERATSIAALAGAFVLLLIVASAASAARGGPPGAAPPTPAATPEASSPPAPATAPAEEPPPRIIRTVCTDHVCGGCDGKCRKTSGHVAIDKKGHCACTPTDGSPLDRAVRQAYERHPPQ